MTDTVVVPAVGQSAGVANDFHVVIIGAGLAGLSTACELLEHFPSASLLPSTLSTPLPVPLLPRLRLTVLEARSRVGGRLHSLPSNGLEMGATWLSPHHRNVWRLSRSLELSIVSDASMPGGAVRIEGGTAQLATRLCEQLTQPAGHASSSVPASSTATTLRLSTVATAVKWDERSGAVAVELADGTSIAGQAVVVAVPPKLAMSRLSFQPALPAALVSGLRGVITWMGSATKVVIVFEAAFWLSLGLPSTGGKGALGEWHDVSSASASVHALMGFGPPGITAADVDEQLRLSYGPHYQAPVSVHVVDWSAERWTSSDARLDGLGGHPHTTGQQRQPLWKESLFFASTEMAEQDAGYMEGAVVRGRQVADQISAALQRRFATTQKLS